MVWETTPLDEEGWTKKPLVDVPKNPWKCDGEDGGSTWTFAMDLSYRFFVLAGYAGESVRGWHSLVGRYCTLADAKMGAAPFGQAGRWYQIVDAVLGEVVEYWPGV